MLSRHEIWSRFVYELVIWTQPSGPLCLWQCLINTYQMSCHKALVWSHVSKYFIAKYSLQVPVLLHLSGCKFRLQHQLHLWRTLLVRKYFQRWLKVTKYPTIWSPKMAQSHQKIQTFYLQSHLSSKSQQYDHYQEDDLDLRPDLPCPLCQRCWSLIPTKDLIWH